MQPHEEGVINEKRDLDEKIAKLKAFCYPGSDAFCMLPRDDQFLLESQYGAMLCYSDILGRRIARFTGIALTEKES